MGAKTNLWWGKKWKNTWCSTKAVDLSTAISEISSSPRFCRAPGEFLVIGLALRLDNLNKADFGMGKIYKHQKMGGWILEVTNLYKSCGSPCPFQHVQSDDVGGLAVASLADRNPFYGPSQLGWCWMETEEELEALKQIFQNIWIWLKLTWNQPLNMTEF